MPDLFRRPTYVAGWLSTVKKEYGYRDGQLLVVWNGDEVGDKQLKRIVEDHLGSVRMKADRSVSLAGMVRHDYLPFGEELFAGIRREGSNGQYGYEQCQVRKQRALMPGSTSGNLSVATSRSFSHRHGETGEEYRLAFHRNSSTILKHTLKVELQGFQDVPASLINRIGKRMASRQSRHVSVETWLIRFNHDCKIVDRHFASPSCSGERLK